MYLALQSTYTSVEVALCSQGSLDDVAYIDKYQASSQLLVAMDTLCKRRNITSDQLEYIVACAGPGPFTTLRTVLATANGLAMAHGLKLVAVDGLRALLEEYALSRHSPDVADKRSWTTAEYPVTVALLNAYSGDLYYALDDQGLVTTGILYGRDALVQMLKQLPNTTVRFIGNGVPLHAQLIGEIVGERVFIPEPNPETCSLQAVARLGYQQWLAGEHISEQLVPLYLKKY